MAIDLESKLRAGLSALQRATAATPARPAPSGLTRWTDAAWRDLSGKIDQVAEAAARLGVLTPRAEEQPAEPKVKPLRPFRPSAPAPEREPHAAGAPREYGASRSSLAASLTDGEDVKIASVRHPLLPPVHVQLRRERGSWQGSATARDGSRVDVRIHDAHQLEVTIAGLTTMLRARSAPTVLEEARDAGAELGPWIAARLADPCTTPAQRDALSALAALPELPDGSSLAFAKVLARHVDLTAADAADVPLLHTWLVASRAADRAEALAQGMASLVDSGQISGRAATAISDAVRAAEQTPQELRFYTLLAGLFTARAARRQGAVDPLADFHALASAWPAALWIAAVDHLGDATHGPRMASAWRLALQSIVRALPATHPGRAVLEAALAPLAGPRWQQACAGAALALGECCQLVDHGRSTGASAEGLPALPLVNASEALHVRRLDAPLGADAAHPRDVVQSPLLFDCSFASAMIAIAAARPDAIAACVAQTSDEGGRGFEVRWQAPKGRRTVTRRVRVDDRFYARRDGSMLFGSAGQTDASHAPAKLWFPLLEKAFAHLRGARPDYGAAEFALPHEVFAVVFGTQDVHEAPLAKLSMETALDTLQSAIRDSLPLACGTFSQAGQYNGGPLSHGHAYAILGLVRRDGGVHVQLQNPLVSHPTPLGGLAGAVQTEVIGGATTVVGKVGEVLELPLQTFVESFDCLYWAALPPRVTPESRARALLSPS